VLKKYGYVVLALSLCLNLYLGGYLSHAFLRAAPAAAAVANIISAGIYGPVGMDTIEGDATISAPDVIMQNTIITGNLYLTEDIGEGQVTLHNVTVLGETLISGGGANSVILDNTTLGLLTINKQGSAVRVIARGKTSINATTLAGAAILQERELREDAPGFLDIIIDTAMPAILDGHFNTIRMEIEQAELTLQDGRALMIQILPTARNARLTVAEAATADTVEVGAASDLICQGQMGSLVVSAAGLTRLSGSPAQVQLSGNYISLELLAGTLPQLQVTENLSHIALKLMPGSVVENLALHSACTVTGEGRIVSLFIHASGTTVETLTAPEKTTLAKGVTALVCGKELPVIQIAQQPATPKPPTATNPTNPVTPPPPPPPEPHDVKSFTVKDGLSVGKKMVLVTIYAEDPSVYQVTVGGERLNYLPSKKYFYGEVADSAAHVRNVRVFR
jgi:hypothetical protein